MMMTKIPFALEQTLGIGTEDGASPKDGNINQIILNYIKPIFHQKPGSRWPDANEIDTNNMKSEM